MPARPTQPSLFGLQQVGPPPPAVPYTPLLDVIGRSRRAQLVPAAGSAGDGVGRIRICPSGNATMQVEDGACICQRPHAVVLCHVCGWYSRCRLMKPCREHPNTRFLLDLTACPRCRALSHLMSEYDNIEERIRPCTLPMPLDEVGHKGRRSPSPCDAASGMAEGGGGGAGGGVGLRSGQMPGGGGGWPTGSRKRPSSPAPPRTRMRPPLQSDGHGMQRKARDRFCSHRMARTPSGLPMYYEDMRSGDRMDGRAGGCCDAEMCWGVSSGLGIGSPLRGRRRN